MAWTPHWVTLQDARDFLKNIPATQLSDEMLEMEIAAEFEDQKMKCNVPLDESNYPAALYKAHLRRIKRAIALNNQPLGVITGLADGAVGTSRVSGLDREIDRLEAKYRKLVNG